MCVGAVVVSIETLDPGRDGKLMAVDLFHLYGYHRSLLCYELDSWCPQRVSVGHV